MCFFSVFPFFDSTFHIFCHFISFHSKEPQNHDDAEFNTVFDTFIWFLFLFLFLFFRCFIVTAVVWCCVVLLRLFQCAASMVLLISFYFLLSFAGLRSSNRKSVCILSEVHTKHIYVHMHAIIVVRCCLSQRCHCFDHVAFLLVLVLMLSLSTTTTVVIVNLTGFSFAVSAAVVRSCSYAPFVWSFVLSLSCCNLLSFSTVSLCK